MMGSAAPFGGLQDVLQVYLRAARTPPTFSSGPVPGGAVGKQYPGAPRVFLPTPSPRPRLQTTCDLRQLSDLLALSFGVSRLRHSPGSVARSAPGLLRAVASGGALYPSELYLLHRGIAGLEDGLSHYDPIHHQLERLRSERSDGPSQESAGQLWLLLTSATWKTAYKYQAFSYRPLTLELGLLAEQVRTVGTVLGARCSAHPFPEAANDLLALTEGELPGMLLGLHWLPDREVERAATAGTFLRRLRLSAATGGTGQPCPGVPTLRDFPAAWHLQQAAALHSHSGDTGLPPPMAAAGGITPLVRAMRSRRSCSQGFRAAPVPGGQLREVLQCSSGIDGVELLLVARKVIGLAPGTYRYDMNLRELLPTGIGHDSANLGPLLRGGAADNVEQSSHPAAWVYPVVTLLPADQGRAGDYRRAQISAGRMLQRLQLACTLQGVDSHISLAYDVAVVQRGFDLNELEYPAAQMLLGRALPSTEGLEVRL